MKKIIIPSIIIGVALCLCNLFLPLIWYNDLKTQLIVSALSGWVSGVATLFIGVIALFQTKKYKELNDSFLEKEYELEKNKTLIQSRLMFVDNLKKNWSEYRNVANPGIMITKIISLKDDLDNQGTYQIILETRFSNRAAFSALDTTIKCDYKESEEKHNVVKQLYSYRELSNSMFDKIGPESEPDEAISLLIKEMTDPYLALAETIDKYVLACDFDINNAIANQPCNLSDVYFPQKDHTDN